MTKAISNFKPTGIKGIFVNWSKDVAPLEKYLLGKGWDIKVERSPTDGDNFDHKAFLGGNLIFQTPCLATAWSWLWALAYGHVYDPETAVDAEMAEMADLHDGQMESTIENLEAEVAMLRGALMNAQQESAIEIQHELGQKAALQKTLENSYATNRNLNARLRELENDSEHIDEIKAELASMVRRYKEQAEELKMALEAKENLFGDYCWERGVVANLSDEIRRLKANA